jgi:hypothetical protein
MITVLLLTQHFSYIVVVSLIGGGNRSTRRKPMQLYVIKFVSDLPQVGGFLWVLRFPSSNKTDHHDTTEILLKVALDTIN